MPGRRLLRNAARCLACGEEIDSRQPGEAVTCGCGALTVSGGLADPFVTYEARPGGGFEDLSVAVDVIDGDGDGSDAEVSAPGNGRPAGGR